MQKIFVQFSIAAILLFSSCEGPSIDSDAYVAYIGELIEVDSKGHFVEDVIYTHGLSRSYSFKNDGTYENWEYEYEDTNWDCDQDGVLGEGWVLDDGWRGTYFYDSTTYELTVTYSQWYYSGDPDGGYWVDYTSVAEKTWPRVFGEHQFQDLYEEVSSGVWQYTTHYSRSWINEENEQETFRSTYTRTVSIDGSIFSVVRKDEETYQEDGLNVTGVAWLDNESGEILGAYPSSVISDGSYTTFQVMMDQNYGQWWIFDEDITSATYGTFIEDGTSDYLSPGDVYNYNYIGFGDYMFDADGTWDRGLCR